MGLISKTAIVKWHCKNKEHYTSKGYTFTKFKDEFEVNVEDLQQNSHVEVEVQCDMCKTIKKSKWQKFRENIKEDGTCYCMHCINKYNFEKTMNTKLDKTISFEKWCLDNNRQDILNRWSKNNNKKPSEVMYKSHLSYAFSCPNKMHEDEHKKLNDIASGRINEIVCTQCNSFAEWGIQIYGENFLEQYWEYDLNKDIDPYKIHKASRKEIWIKCTNKDYHIYPTTCALFYSGERCGYCKGLKVHYLDSLGTSHPQVLEIWSDKNNKSPFEFMPNSTKKAWFKCKDNKHSDSKRIIKNGKNNNFDCPDCIKEREESSYQEKTRIYLIELGYNLLHEYKCNIIPKNPKTKMPLPFDNEVKELKLIIEVHGKQHYEIGGWQITQSKINNTTVEEEFRYQQLKDRYKRIYAKSQGYKYLELPYWKFDDEDTYKTLISNKIEEILSQRVS